MSEISVKSDRDDLTTGVVWKKLLSFFFPILAGLLFQQLYNTADAFIVGYFLDDNALAAVGSGVGVITNLILGFFVGLISGGTVMISQAYGANDRDKLSRVLHTCFVFCLCVGAVITVTGYYLAPAALRLINTHNVLMDDSTRYLRIYLVGAIPLLTYNLFQGTLQGVGGLGWKVAGAAWACVLSMCTCTGLALRHFLTTDGAHRFSFSKIRVDMPSLKRMMRIGLPSGFQSSLYSVSNIIIQAALNGLNDTPLITAWTAKGRLDGFYWVTTSAFGVAICAFAGQCYGAGKYERLKQAMKVCMGISLAVTAALSVTLLSVARPVYRLFVEHETTIDKAIEIMWCFVPFYVLWSYIEVMTGTLRGMGDTFEPMIITLIGTCLFRVLWMTLLVPVWPTIPGISLVYPVSWLITGTAFTVYFLRKLRRGII
ncbi:MAG: MATE family efflux transporter [Clostridia bacterium]|nr:MATE family efflux transporter [Clostridia bacterium]